MANLKFSTAAILLLCSSVAAMAQGFGSTDPGGPPPVVIMPAKEYASSQAQYDALLKAAHGGTRLTRGTAPDWSGIWTRVDRGPPVSAPLNAKYQKALAAKIANMDAGKPWDRLSDCLPSGFPRWLAEPWLREFVVTPAETWMTHEQINETRRIYTDGRAHVTENIPLWMGDSIGFWNKGTLVIHTTHMKAGDYQPNMGDFSFNVSTVEEWRMTAPGVLEAQVTTYDPSSLTRPFHQAFRYKKLSGDVRLNYVACEENNNTYRNPDGTSNERLPGEPGFRDPQHFGIPEVAWDSIPH